MSLTDQTRHRWEQATARGAVECKAVHPRHESQSSNHDQSQPSLDRDCRQPRQMHPHLHASQRVYHQRMVEHIRNNALDSLKSTSRHPPPTALTTTSPVDHTHPPTEWQNHSGQYAPPLLSEDASNHCSTSTSNSTSLPSPSGMYQSNGGRYDPSYDSRAGHETRRQSLSMNVVGSSGLLTQPFDLASAASMDTAPYHSVNAGQQYLPFEGLPSNDIAMHASPDMPQSAFEKMRNDYSHLAFSDTGLGLCESCCSRDIWLTYRHSRTSTILHLAQRHRRLRHVAGWSIRLCQSVPTVSAQRRDARPAKPVGIRDGSGPPCRAKHNVRRQSNIPAHLGSQLISDLRQRSKSDRRTGRHSSTNRKSTYRFISHSHDADAQAEHPESPLCAVSPGSSILSVRIPLPHERSTSEGFSPRTRLQSGHKRKLTWSPSMAREGPNISQAQKELELAELARLESGGPELKEAKRKLQNRLAQRAFRARSKLVNSAVSREYADQLNADS